MELNTLIEHEFLANIWISVRPWHHIMFIGKIWESLANFVVISEGTSMGTSLLLNIAPRSGKKNLVPFCWFLNNSKSKPKRKCYGKSKQAKRKKIDPLGYRKKNIYSGKFSRFEKKHNIYNYGNRICYFKQVKLCNEDLWQLKFRASD